MSSHSSSEDISPSDRSGSSTSPPTQTSEPVSSSVPSSNSSMPTITHTVTSKVLGCSRVHRSSTVTIGNNSKRLVQYYYDDDGRRIEPITTFISESSATDLEFGGEQARRDRYDSSIEHAKSDSTVREVTSAKSNFTVRDVESTQSDSTVRGVEYIRTDHRMEHIKSEQSRANIAHAEIERPDSDIVHTTQERITTSLKRSLHDRIEPGGELSKYETAASNIVHTVYEKADSRIKQTESENPNFDTGARYGEPGVRYGEPIVRYGEPEIGGYIPIGGNMSQSTSGRSSKTTSPVSPLSNFSSPIADPELEGLNQDQLESRHAIVTDKTSIHYGTTPPGCQCPDYSVEENDDRCGYGNCEPDCLQMCHNPPCLLIVLCLMIIVQGMLVNGFVSTSITTLQKRFYLTSTSLGTAIIMYDVAFLIVAIPLTHYAASPYAHKGMIIGLGTIVMGLGGLVFALPQFTTGPYVYGEALEMFCDESKEKSQNSSIGCGMSESGLSYYIWVFGAAAFLLGLGCTPMFTLSFVYLDENVPRKNSALYTGVYYGLSVIGPALGYMLSGVFLGIYGEIGFMDTSEINLDEDDPRWYGAWWIGFILTAIMAFAVAVPLCGFAKHLPGNLRQKHSGSYIQLAQLDEEEKRRKSSVGSHGTNISTRSKSYAAPCISLGDLGDILNLPMVLNSLAHNTTYIFLVLSDAFDAFLLNGVVTFFPKFLENQFSLTVSKAAFYGGAVIVSAGGSGAILSGIVIRSVNLSTRGVLRFSSFMLLISLVFMFGLFLRCDDPNVAGVTVEYSSGKPLRGSVSLQHACNQRCGCNVDIYEPVCDSMGVIYYSPCYAGCTHSDQGNYVNCSCAPPSDKSTPSDGCTKPCGTFMGFLVVFFFIVFFSFLASTPAIQAVLRCVKFTERSLATGVAWVVARLLGTIPGPIAFGAVIDSSCIIWSSGCAGQRTCFIYNNEKMSRDFVIFSIVFRALSFGSMALASFSFPRGDVPEASSKYVPPPETKTVDSSTRLVP